MLSGVRISLLGLLVASAVSLLSAQNGDDARLWLTTADRSSLLAVQAPLHFKKKDADFPAIVVDDKKRYQQMDGFGFALTGGSAQLLMKMSQQRRSEVLHELFGTAGEGIGVSYVRVSIGSSDMNDHAFTYDDLSSGQTDESLRSFSLGPDATTVVPVLKEILAINSSIKILGSPWSAPAWMKTNAALKGGSLKPEYYVVYAQYFVTYLKAMAAQGIHLAAITIQNEPLNPNNTPSMVMEAEDQAVFIRQALGPAFRKAGISTNILVYDHNCDKPDYAMTILKDADAAQYVDGSGFHLYGGEISALSQVHDAYPAKNLYFTEQMVVDKGVDSPLPVAHAVARLIVGAPRNWSRNVLLWNLAADSKFGPHTGDGGCPVCEGAITVDGDKVTKNVAWYVVAHASRFARPGSMRIESSEVAALPNVAFLTPEGKRVLIVANPGHAAQTFQIQYAGKAVISTLSGEAVGTYVW